MFYASWYLVVLVYLKQYTPLFSVLKLYIDGIAEHIAYFQLPPHFTIIHVDTHKVASFTFAIVWISHKSSSCSPTREQVVCFSMVSLVPKETCMRLFTAAQLVLAKLWELLKYPNTSPHCSWRSFLIVQVSSCPSPAPNLSLAPCCQISFPLVPYICPYSLPLKLYSFFSSHIELTSTSRPFSFTHKALCVLILPPPQLISYPPALSCAWFALLPVPAPLPLATANPFAHPPHTPHSQVSPHLWSLWWTSPTLGELLLCASSTALAAIYWSTSQKGVLLVTCLFSCPVWELLVFRHHILHASLSPPALRFGTWNVVTKYVMS